VHEALHLGMKHYIWAKLVYFPCFMLFGGIMGKSSPSGHLQQNADIFCA
jgi:hypothetical protein